MWTCQVCVERVRRDGRVALAAALVLEAVRLPARPPVVVLDLSGYLGHLLRFGGFQKRCYQNFGIF